ncbi:hypothetical protein BGW80DRAFT_1291526 [Lactifluus volemus]|nr:hypothetical protein BGW80DRAFT_1291526 [Lactifluus volemus]
MAPHPNIFSFGNNYGTPPVSNRASVVSVDTILSDSSAHERSFSTPEASRIADSRIKGALTSLVIEPSGSGGRASAHPETDPSFTKHEKYFFKDGNVTFLVDGSLYCVHRYFFSRDSVYFSTRFAQLDIRDHEALPTIISLGDIEREDFEAFLSVIYPEDFEEPDLSYKEWKSVLHLSTLWGFASLRKLAIRSIYPPTPHDRLLLARTYSVDHWVLPALTALCERNTPLSLDEARQMSIEDVVLVATVREDIRNNTIQVKAIDIPCRVEAAQAGKLSFKSFNFPEAPNQVPVPGSALGKTTSPNAAEYVGANVAPPSSNLNQERATRARGLVDEDGSEYEYEKEPEVAGGERAVTPPEEVKDKSMAEARTTKKGMPSKALAYGWGTARTSKKSM